MTVVMQQTNKNNNCPLSITTGATTVCSGSEENWFRIRCLKNGKINVDKQSV